jgi:hypothetical protein
MKLSRVSKRYSTYTQSMAPLTLLGSKARLSDSTEHYQKQLVLNLLSCYLLDAKTLGPNNKRWVDSLKEITTVYNIT